MNAVPSLTKKRQKFIPAGVTAVDPDNIDLDEILGDIPEEAQPSKFTPTVEKVEKVAVKDEAKEDSIAENLESIKPGAVMTESEL